MQVRSDTEASADEGDEISQTGLKKKAKELEGNKRPGDSTPQNGEPNKTKTVKKVGYRGQVIEVEAGDEPEKS